MQRRLGLFSMLACLLACGGGGDEGSQPVAGAGGAASTTPAAGGGAGTPAVACDAEVDVFPLLCATSICHDGALNGVDLIAPGVDERLLDVPAASISCRKSGLHLVDSHDPDRSLMLLKLSETPPCGPAMPLGSGPSGLTKAQLDCVDSFVRTLAAR